MDRPRPYRIFTDIEPDVYEKSFHSFHEALAYAISLTIKRKHKKLLARNEWSYNIWCEMPDDPDGPGYLVFGRSLDEDINKLVGGEWYFAGGW